MYMLYIVFYVSLIASFYLDMITMGSSLVGQHMFSVALGTSQHWCSRLIKFLLRVSD